jgi:transposase
MNDILHDPSVAAVGPVGSEGGRRPSTLSTAAVVPAGVLAPGQRWSVRRKREVVLRLLRGESAESLRALGVPLYRLEGWRERALSGIDGSLREREGDAVSEELRVLDGLRVARKRILRLMRENGLLSPHRHLPRSRCRRPSATPQSPQPAPSKM